MLVEHGSRWQATTAGLETLYKQSKAEIDALKKRLQAEEENTGKGKGQEWGKLKDWEPKEFDGEEEHSKNGKKIPRTTSMRSTAS